MIGQNSLEAQLDGESLNSNGTMAYGDFLQRNCLQHRWDCRQNLNTHWDNETAERCFVKVLKYQLHFKLLDDYVCQ
jgi:hypothetical protein